MRAPPPVQAVLTAALKKSGHQAFVRSDGDKDGMLTAEELPGALADLRIFPTPEELDSMLAYINATQIDELDFFSLIYYFLRGADTPEQLKSSLRMFARGQAKLPNDKARQILVNLKHPIPGDLADELIQELGQSGSVSIDELAARLAK